MTKRVLAVFFLILAAFAASSPALAVTQSYVISSDLILSAGALACNCTIFIHVLPSSDAYIELAASDAIGSWNPEVVVTANNQAEFTVTTTVGLSDVVLLSGFTTRGAVANNAAAVKWVRTR